MYFESKIVTNRKANKEIAEGTESAGKFYRLVRDILCKFEMLRTGEKCLYKSYYMPMLVFRAETWTWAKTDISRQTTTGIRLLRSVQGKSIGERLRKKWERVLK